MRTILTWFVLLGMGTGAGIGAFQVGKAPDAPGPASAGRPVTELTETAKEGRQASLFGSDLQQTTQFEQRAVSYRPSGDPQDGLPALPSFPPATSGGGSSAPVSSAASAPSLPPSLPPGNATSARTAPPSSQDNAVLPPVYPGPTSGSSPTAPRSLVPNSPPPASLSAAPPTQGTGLSSLPPASAPPARPSPDARPRVPGGTMPNALRGSQSNVPASSTMPPRSSSGSAVRGQEIAYGSGANSGANSGSGMRQVNDGSQAPNGRLNPNEIATGLPYVTPAPRGRYPTSPYNHALFQNAAYRRQATQGESGNPPGQLTSAQVLPSRSGPPARPGIYPTSYQQTSGTLPPANTPGALSPTASTVACPPQQAQQVYSMNNAGYQPLMTMGQDGYNVQVGRGLLGQPTVYVPGQPMRNFLRYIFP